MRIIGGKFKGRRFKAPKQIPARPTTDFAKESLFNILGNQLQWSHTDVLDLFSGIGNISLEALSRGANSVTSVDLNASSVKWQNKLRAELELSQWHIHKGNALKWLDKHEQLFDLVFADPPYDVNFYTTLIDKTLEEKLLEGGIFVLEHRKNIDFENHDGLVESRTYGEVKFSFFEKTKQ